MAIQNYREIFLKKFMDNEGICEICNEPLSGRTPQLAHILEKSKHNIKKYGIKVIDHPLNLRLVCSLNCNLKVLIGKSREEIIKQHVARIKINEKI